MFTALRKALATLPAVPEETHRRDARHHCELVVALVGFREGFDFITEPHSTLAHGSRFVSSLSRWWLSWSRPVLSFSFACCTHMVYFTERRCLLFECFGLCCSER